MRRKWVSHRERMPQKVNGKEEKDDGDGWGTGDELEEGGRTRDRTTAASVMVPKLLLGTRTAVVRVPGLFLGTRTTAVRVPGLFLGTRTTAVRVPGLLLGTIIGAVADDREFAHAPPAHALRPVALSSPSPSPPPPPCLVCKALSR